MRVFLSFLVLSQTFVLYLPLTAIQSHVGGLFYLRFSMSSSLHVSLQFPSHVKSFPFHALSVTMVQNCLLFHAYPKLFKPFDFFPIPFSPQNAFSHYFARCTFISSSRTQTSIPQKSSSASPGRVNSCLCALIALWISLIYNECCVVIICLLICFSRQHGQGQCLYLCITVLSRVPGTQQEFYKYLLSELQTFNNYI